MSGSSRDGNLSSVEINDTSQIIEHDGKFVYVTAAPDIKYLVVSGGGAKGAVLLGALQSLEQKRDGTSGSIRDRLEGVAGSSVGAITAAFVATGIPAEQLITNTERLNLKDLLGPGLIKKSGQPLMQEIDNNIAQSLRAYISSCGGNEGIRLSDEYKNLSAAHQAKINEILRKNHEKNFSLTFAQLEALAKFDPETFKELIITATCQETPDNRLWYFSHQTTPDLPIALACRASASLPLILDTVEIPCKLLGVKGEGVYHFNDGGIIDNVPIDLFENARYNQVRGLQGQNLSTLVLVFDNLTKKKAKQMGDSEMQPVLGAANPSKAAVDKENRLMSFITKRFIRRTTHMKVDHVGLYNQRLQSIQEKYTQLNIEYDTLSVGTIGFKKAQEKFKELVKRGKEQTDQYLEVHNEQEALYYKFDNKAAIYLFVPLDELNCLLIKAKENNTDDIALLQTIHDFRVEVANILNSSNGIYTRMKMLSELSEKLFEKDPNADLRPYLNHIYEQLEYRSEFAAVKEAIIAEKINWTENLVVRFVTQKMGAEECKEFVLQALRMVEKKMVELDERYHLAAYLNADNPKKAGAAVKDGLGLYKELDAIKMDLQKNIDEHIKIMTLYAKFDAVREKYPEMNKLFRREMTGASSKLGVFGDKAHNMKERVHHSKLGVKVGQTLKDPVKNAIGLLRRSDKGTPEDSSKKQDIIESTNTNKKR